MSTSKFTQKNEIRKRTFCLRSEGAIPLIKDLLETGYCVRVKVSGRSMQPFLKGGEVVTLQKTPAEKLRKGDLVLFVNEYSSPILHRIVRLRNKFEQNMMVQTKGDACLSLDRSVRDTDIIAHVIKVEALKLTHEGTRCYSSIDLTKKRHKVRAYYIVLSGPMKLWLNKLVRMLSVKKWRKC